jgi:hypothetical protein
MNYDSSTITTCNYFLCNIVLFIEDGIFVPTIVFVFFLVFLNFPLLH